MPLFQFYILFFRLLKFNVVKTFYNVMIHFAQWKIQKAISLKMAHRRAERANIWAIGQYVNK